MLNFLYNLLIFSTYGWLEDNQGRIQGILVGAQNRKCPNRDMPKTFKISNLSKQLKLKKYKRNKPTSQYTNKSLFLQSFRPLFIAVSQAICHVNLLGTRNFWKVYHGGRKDVVEITLCISS